MQLSRNVKQNGTTGVIGVLTVIAVAFLTLYGNQDIEYANAIELNAPGDIVSQLDATGKKIVPVEFGFDAVLTNSAKLELMGGLDLDARPGDVLIFRKDNGVWVEVGRYLEE